ncbi:MAG: hypothetical protein AB1591_08475 [Pseudomonadota bacterium]
MDLATLEALRSPAGVPSHPVIFLVLGVLTWALHILAVHIVLGGGFLSLFGLLKRDNPRWQRLSAMLLEHAKIGVSIAIVVGVAPLLFVQVIYDPFWYVSNVLSARWAIGFILLLLLGYWALWLHYAHTKKAGEKATPAWLGLSLGILLLVGFIMHVLSVQMLSPDQWMSWYAPGGKIDASGSKIHDALLPRWAFIIGLAAPVTGAWLLACRKYLSAREGEDAGYVEFVGAVGRRLALYGGVVSVLLLGAWMSSLPVNMAAFALSPWTLAAAVAVLLLAVAAWKLPDGLAYYLPLLALLMALAVGVQREAYRYAVLHDGFGYDFMNYPIAMDWYSTILFFATFLIVGGIPLAFMLSLSWKAGQARGVYTAGPVIARLGAASVAVALLWVVQYFAFGFWVLAN